MTLHRIATHSLIASAMVVGAAASAAPRDGWVTEPPITYVLDYGSRHLGHPEWLEATASAPPTLLHLGSDVPMSHHWGPRAALGGENQAYGKGEHIRRLSPQEVAERIEGLTQMVADLRAAGVGMVMPYICAMTVAGHHETRAGLWEFYDHWTDYAAFGLGPRPDLDVTHWLQREPDGDFVRFYRYTGDFYPPYEPNHRYAACVNNPAWQHWLFAVTRLCAEGGYDGVFVDNSGSQRCHCDFCQEAFREFLRERYTPAQRERLLGIARLEEARLGAPGEGLLRVETQRFWIESLRRHQVAIKAAGEAVRPGFVVFPNGGHGRPEHVKLAYCDSDYIMFEKSIGDYGTNPGMARFKVVEEIAVKKYNDNIYEYKLTEATRSGVKPIILSRGGYPRREPELDLNHDAACLGMAEAAAFGSGGGFLIRPDYRTFGPALNRYRSFFENNARLYAGYRPYAPVGVLAFPEQNLYGNRDHITLLQRTTRALADEHILFDYLMEEDARPERLAGFAAIVAPGVRFVTQEQVAALDAYVQAGGCLLVTDPLPEFDMTLTALPATPLAALGEAPVSHGLGRVQRLPTVPRRGLAETLNELTGRDLRALTSNAGEAPMSVRMNARQGAADGTHGLVVHLLNYGTPLGVEAAPPAPVEGLELVLPARDLRAARAQAWTPEADEPADVPVARQGDELRIAVPAFSVYQLITLDGNDEG